MPHRRIALFTITMLFLSFGFVASAANSRSAIDTDPTPEPTATPVPSPTPSAEELRLQEEIRLLTLQNEKAKLEKAIRETAPTPTITPLPGSAEFKESDKLSMEIEVQSYRAMNSVADNITCDIRKSIPGPFTVVFYKAEDYAAWRNYNLVAPTLRSQINGMKQEYKAWLTSQEEVDIFGKSGNLTVLTVGKNKTNSPGAAAITLPVFPGITTALAGITGSVKAFAELMSLFRTDVSFTERNVKLEPEALKSSVARSFITLSDRTINRNRAISCDCPDKYAITIFDPANFAPAAAGKKGAFDSEVLGDLQQLIELQRLASIKIAEYKVVEADTKLLPPLEQKVETIKAAIKVKDAQVAALTENLRNAKEEAEKAPIRLALANAIAEQANLGVDKENAVAAVADLRQKLAAYAGELTIPNRVRISRLEALNTELSSFIDAFTKSSNNTASLLSQYVKAENLNSAFSATNVYWLRINAVKGGGNTRVQKNLFRYFYKPDVSHSGGAIIEYSLSDRDGSIVLGNTDFVYLKYRKAGNIQQQ